MMVFHITREQVSYTYDQLNRLVQSASNFQGHSMTFTAPATSTTPTATWSSQL
jgi:hypothetical protein